MSDEKIKVGCPGCKSKLKLTNEHLGIDITCPKCQTIFRISAKTTDQSSVPNPAADKPVAQQTKPVAKKPNQPKPTPAVPIHPPLSVPGENVIQAQVAPDQSQPIPVAPVPLVPMSVEPLEAVAPLQPVEPLEAVESSYWQSANYSGEAVETSAPVSRADRLKAAQQKKSNAAEDDPVSDTCMRIGGFLIVLAFAGAVLPFVGLQLKIGGPLVGMVAGLIGCVLLAVALRDNILTAIGSAAGAALFVVVACVGSHVVNDTSADDYNNNANNNSVVEKNRSKAKKEAADLRKRQNELAAKKRARNIPGLSNSPNSNSVAQSNNTSTKTKIDRIIDSNKTREAVTVDPFKEVGHANESTAGNSSFPSDGDPSNPFGTTTEPESVATNTPTEPDDNSNPFGNKEPDDDSNPFGATGTGSPNALAKDDDSSNPFAMSEDKSNSSNSVANSKSADDENPFGANVKSKDDDNPFAVTPSNDNPFAVDGGGGSGKFDAANTTEPLVKMTKEEEEKIFQERPNSGARLERGLPVEGAMMNGRKLLPIVGKAQRIGLAMHQGSPVIGLAWGTSFGRLMVIPIYPGDKQFSNEVRAESGYVLVGLNVGLKEKKIDGVQAVFSKPENGQLNMSQTKSSDWLGEKTRKSLAEKLRTNGPRVVGLSLQLRATDITGVGLIVD